MKALILCGGFGTRYNKKNKTKVFLVKGDLAKEQDFGRE